MAITGKTISELDSATLASLREYSKPYLVYAAQITQSGTNNPVPTELENTIGNIEWTRVTGGTYTVTSTTTGFTEDVTISLHSECYLVGTGVTYMESTWGSTSGITITTKNVDLELTDGLMTNRLFEIRVYSVIPSPTPTPTPSVTPSVTPSITVSPSVTPSITPSITVSPSVTPSITPSPII